MRRDVLDPPVIAPVSEPVGAAADVLDRVSWDFDAEDELLSPLVTTERYFRDSRGVTMTKVDRGAMSRGPDVLKE
ncbi:MAG TPA: hypothetical protein VNM92_06360 [Thermoanaerobaculia bacterium]|nr:hypothetical protein [Thermoanaerobaculia bacterium]